MLAQHVGQSCLREAVQEIASKEELSLHLGVVAQVSGPWMTMDEAALRTCVCVYQYVRYIKYYIIEGSLEVKLPTVWTDEKQRWEESDRREE